MSKNLDGKSNGTEAQQHSAALAQPRVTQSIDAFIAKWAASGAAEVVPGAHSGAAEAEEACGGLTLAIR